MGRNAFVCFCCCDRLLHLLYDLVSSLDAGGAFDVACAYFVEPQSLTLVLVNLKELCKMIYLVR